MTPLQEYLASEGLINMLRTNSGGKNPPQIWISQWQDGTYHYLTTKSTGRIGGEIAPFDSVYEGKICRDKQEDVLQYLQAFGLSILEASEVIEEIGVLPVDPPSTTSAKVHK